MCSLSDPETKAIVNEIVQDVAVKKGVKRTVEELVGDDTFSKYMEAFVCQIGCSFISRQRQECQQRRNDCLPTAPCNHISATLSKMAHPFASCNVQVNLNFFIPWLIYFDSIYRSG